MSRTSQLILHFWQWVGWEWTEPRQLTQTAQRDIPCHVTSHWTVKPRELVVGAANAQRATVHWSVGGKQLHCASLVPWLFFSPSFFFFLLIVFNWTHECYLLSTNLLSNPTSRGVSEQLNGVEVPSGFNYNTYQVQIYIRQRIGCWHSRKHKRCPHAGGRTLLFSLGKKQSR